MSNTQYQGTYRLQPWVVCLVAALFFFYEFVQMSMFNAVNSHLMHDFSISSTQLGTLAATYFYANILFMFPAGLLLDRYSTKSIILVAMVICVIGTFTFSMAHTLSTALICRFLIGIGGSFPFLSCLRLATRWFPPFKLAGVTGVIITVALLGGVVAQTPLTLIVESYGWRQAVLYDSFLGVFVILLIIMLVKNAPKSYMQQQKSQDIAPPLWASIKQVAGNAQNWLYGSYTCMLNLPIFLIAQTWGSLYLTQVHHVTLTQASYCTSMVFLGTIIGSPILGWVSDTIKNRKKPMLYGAILSLAIISSIMINDSMSFNAMLMLFFALGVCTSTQILSYPAISESNNSNIVGGALGLASVLIMSGGAIFEPLFGWLMQWHWDGKLINDLPIYSNHDYLNALFIMPIAFIIGIGVIIIAKEPGENKQKQAIN